MDQVVFLTLLLIHVGGAIIGFGPTFTFAILGPMAGGAGPNGVWFLQAIVAIARRLVVPIAAVTQPLSGIALIFVGGFASDFFKHYWLVVAIVIYVINVYLALFQSLPSIERMIALAKAGGPPTPEFMALARKTQRLGPITTLLLVTIIFLMVVKPGN